MSRPSDIWSFEASGDVFDRTITEECGGNLDNVLYKPKNQSQQQGGKNVWNKPSPPKMVNGQDFLLELRRQVTALNEKEKAATQGADGHSASRARQPPQPSGSAQQPAERAGG